MMLRSDIRSACLAIADRDPDGWETVAPTDIDRLAHQEWAYETFGPDIYRTYFRTEWRGVAVV